MISIVHCVTVTHLELSMDCVGRRGGVNVIPEGQETSAMPAHLDIIYSIKDVYVSFNGIHRQTDFT